MRRILIACGIIATLAACECKAQTARVPSCSMMDAGPAKQTCWSEYFAMKPKDRERAMVTVDLSQQPKSLPDVVAETSGPVGAAMDARSIAREADVELIRLRNRMYPYR